MNPRIWVAESFSVKNRCPVFQIRQFDSSPSTQTSKKSDSSRSRILIVSSVTLRTCRAAGGGAVSGSGSGSSSSNGRSKRSDIREIRQLFEAVTQSLDLECPTRLLVGLDDDGVQPGIAFRSFEADWHPGQKSSEHCLHLDANDRIMRPGHSDLRHIGLPARQHPILGRLHMRMCADYGGDLAVEMPAHRHLLRRGLGVKVDEDDARAGLERFALLDHDGKGIIDAGHEHATHDVDDPDGDAAGGSREITAVAGHAGGEVGWPQQARLGANVVDRLFPIPDVIARRHDVEAAVEQLIADLAGDAEAGCGIFHVADDEIDLVIVAERRQAATNQLAAGTTDDVADEEKANHATGRSPAAIWIAIVRPRRSVSFGSQTRSSPLTREARAWLESHGFARRATRAKRP